MSTVVKVKVAQSCFTYDRASLACRDPERRRELDHFLEVRSEHRHRIMQFVAERMSELATECSVECRGDAIAELTYFNSWLLCRGGWEG
jgi:hypothetical protein